MYATRLKAHAEIYARAYAAHAEKSELSHNCAFYARKACEDFLNWEKEVLLPASDITTHGAQLMP